MRRKAPEREKGPIGPNPNPNSGAMWLPERVAFRQASLSLILDKTCIGICCELQKFEAGVHSRTQLRNESQDGLGRVTQTLDHVVVVHILIQDKTKYQINECSDSMFIY